MSDGFQLAPLHYFLIGDARPPAHAGELATMRRNSAPLEGPAGPGKLGVLCTPCSGFAPCSFDAAAQRWRDLGGGIWLGVTKSVSSVQSLPDLFARPQQRPGHAVKLGDGHEWQIVPARLALGGSGLPRRRVLLEDGLAGWEVDAAYRHLADVGEKIWSQLNGQPAGLSEADVDEICGAALAVNYRLGTLEALALGLLTDAAITGILEALVDMPTVRAILEAQKKTSVTPAP